MVLAHGGGASDGLLGAIADFVGFDDAWIVGGRPTDSRRTTTSKEEVAKLGKHKLGATNQHPANCRVDEVCIVRFNGPN